MDPVENFIRRATTAVATFVERLHKITSANKSLVCIGLDPDQDLLPIRDVYDFCVKIIDEVQGDIVALKPNLAFFEAMGIDGLRVLERIITHVRCYYPEILLIGDGKRSDIGSTSIKYASAMFRFWDFDAVTVNAFAGRDSIQPFLDYSDKGVFVWCKSSNPGGSVFQNIEYYDESLGEDSHLYHLIARKVVDWNVNGNAGLIVGATYPSELARVRQIAPGLPILVPGIGAQEGSLKHAVESGIDLERPNLLISSSRKILYASGSVDEYPKASHQAVLNLNHEINGTLASLDRRY